MYSSGNEFRCRTSLAGNSLVRWRPNPVRRDNVLESRLCDSSELSSL